VIREKRTFDADFLSKETWGRFIIRVGLLKPGTEAETEEKGKIMNVL
jgi:hypothetical protein